MHGFVRLVLHAGIKDCETMCMVSSGWSYTLELRIATPCAWFRQAGPPELRTHAHGHMSAVRLEDCEPVRTVSAHRLSSNEDYETKHIVTSSAKDESLMKIRPGQETKDVARLRIAP